jgi:outer membrane protein assembly factor BamB
MEADYAGDSRKLPAAKPANIPAGAARLRVWPAVLTLAIFWAALFAIGNANFSTSDRFRARLIAFGVFLLGFLAWWFTRRALSWRDRLLAPIVVIVAGGLGFLVADDSMIGLVYGVSAFPFVFTAWIAWLAVGRSLPPAIQRAGFGLAILLTCGYFSLLRWEGIDATVRPEMCWRWSPTSEQQFLVSHQSAVKSENAEPEADARSWTLRLGDCPEFRGPRRDGVVSGIKLASDWEAQPPKLLWRNRVGPGWSGVIVVDNHLVTQEQRGEAETVVCYDAATGSEIWVHKDAVRFDEKLAGVGPRATPTFRDGRIYTFGATGRLSCLAAEAGSVIWSRDATVDAGLDASEIPTWGYSVSPLVADDLVVVFPGGTKDKSLLAYRADGGELAWSQAAGKTTYSSPQLMTLDGVEQIVMHDGHALAGYDIAAGTKLWEKSWTGQNGAPMLQPHLTAAGDLLISTEPGAAQLRINRDGDQWNVTPQWETKTFRPGFSDFVVHDGLLLGLDNGILCCYEVASGKRTWKKGRYGHGQVVLLVDQRALLITSDTGEVILASVSADGHEVLGRFQAIEGKTWNSPVIADGRLFLRNAEEMAAFELEVEAGTPSL